MVAVLILLPIIYFYPAVMGEVSLVAGDGWTQNLGVRVLIGRMIAHGQIPLWNPFIFAGTPLLASIYPGALYLPELALRHLLTRRGNECGGYHHLPRGADRHLSLRSPHRIDSSSRIDRRYRLHLRRRTCWLISGTPHG